ncbi:hypothetical protein E1301_Tti022862 [Triplophysa tibetana]|uniref:Uncharacterized protein n=1 Tax=Triplophysa tibetana TaxID=1572043 RepID=A0A5A9NRB7_9TELE|nr:hypothetical protein E1301_Tti022862 [Triplophysa tibetana]
MSRGDVPEGTHFVITDLYFACKYRVSVKPLTEQGQRSEAMTSVTTPPCSSLMSRRKKASACVIDEHYPQPRKALQRPEKLAALFQVLNGSVQAAFSWQLSPEGPGPVPITGFRFSCAKVPNRNGTALPSQTHILPPTSLKEVEWKTHLSICKEFQSLYPNNGPLLERLKEAGGSREEWGRIGHEGPGTKLL